MPVVGYPLVSDRPLGDTKGYFRQRHVRIDTSVRHIDQTWCRLENISVHKFVFRGGTSNVRTTLRFDLQSNAFGHFALLLLVRVLVYTLSSATTVICINTQDNRPKFQSFL